jgi:SAM-dependent methyltransferase
MMPNNHCPLCHANNIRPFHQDTRRHYLQCQQCQLVFADRSSLLSDAEELAQYQLHENNLDDPGYRRFLDRLAQPLLCSLPETGLSGLDFGCGPGPLLAKMLREAGQHMAVWDPYFAADTTVLQQRYDFISCSEAIEHFINPAHEWALWLKLLKPGGTLAIMTKRYTTAAAFAGWHYKLDPTHVSFFSTDTFAYLAERDGFTLNIADKDVVILQLRKH